MLRLLLPAFFSSGLFQPCYENWAALKERQPHEVSLTIPLQFERIEQNSEGKILVCSPQCHAVDWSTLIGKKVRIQYERIEKQEDQQLSHAVTEGEGPQMLLPTEIFDKGVRDHFKHLREETLSTGHETGYWVAITKSGKRLVSDRFASEDAEHIAKQAIQTGLDSLRDKLARLRIGTNQIKELIFIHTHPKTVPLSPGDLLNLENVAAQLPAILIRYIAVPAERSDFVFLKSLNYPEG